jgi:hypothetical protein
MKLEQRLSTEFGYFSTNYVFKSSRAPAILSLVLNTAILARNEFLAWSCATTSASNDEPSTLAVVSEVDAAVQRKESTQQRAKQS